jgi:hypothetical protein
MDFVHVAVYAICILVCLGFLCWLLTLVPMPAPFPALITGVAIFVGVLLILSLFFPSFFSGFRTLR